MQYRVNKASKTLIFLVPALVADGPFTALTDFFCHISLTRQTQTSTHILPLMFLPCV
jgi:hypothetical protein